MQGHSVSRDRRQPPLSTMHVGRSLITSSLHFLIYKLGLTQEDCHSLSQ